MALALFTAAGLATSSQSLIAAEDEPQVYVTDRLLLGLYKEPGSGKPVEMLESGAQLTLLDKGANYSRVRTPEGQTGWVKTAYLVEERPARAAMNDTRKELAELQTALKESRGKIATLRSAVDEQRQAAGAARQRAEAANETIRALRRDNQRLERVANRGIPVPPLWLVVGGLASLLIGFVAGVGWLDRRHRKRHGGFRV